MVTRIVLQLNQSNKSSQVRLYVKLYRNMQIFRKVFYGESRLKSAVALSGGSLNLVLLHCKMFTFWLFKGNLNKEMIVYHIHINQAVFATRV